MFKNILIKNYNATICGVIWKASSNSVDSELLKSGPQANHWVPEGFQCPT